MNTHRHPLLYAACASLLLSAPAQAIAAEATDDPLGPLVLGNRAFALPDATHGADPVGQFTVFARSMGIAWSVSSQVQDSGRPDNARASAVALGGTVAFVLGENWSFEPQAQLINQQWLPGLGEQGPRLPSGDAQPGWSGRLGARLAGHYQVGNTAVEPFLRTSLTYSFSNDSPIALAQVDKINSSRNPTAVAVGLGLVARMTPTVSLFVTADYSSPSDENDLNGLIGDVGVRMRW
ncbi:MULTISPECIES: autotransporter domain-containing protein [Pseudomonas]|uniref:Autotransporter outer membrane beta-barrel domain-containing protein n=1 Tax=Pseudomonas eucalypticola TaxID=2599595 RepID=A0A7D5H882_9PSED|nr:MULTISPECIES: autotransporter outer membrane beta-barrel domain-containing protein [Pseudomonas]QKZ05604.1 autotransporter outer membrane beta-barrel domain-containing protein [Pseudomonas eucalypticola]